MRNPRHDVRAWPSVCAYAEDGETNHMHRMRRNDSMNGERSLHTVKRHAITHVHRNGLRGLTFVDTWATREEAQAVLKIYKNPQGLPKILTPEAMTSLEVREVECWARYENPINVYVD